WTSADPVLTFLLLVFQGHMPTHQLLRKYDLIQFADVTKAVRYLLLKTHQLPLDAFLVALKMMQVEDVDIDEVQCILANLIYMVSMLRHDAAPGPR
ncbi:hypothetical protein XENOCAPTIV_029990, partial [Xenoophorus captivus]